MLANAKKIKKPTYGADAAHTWARNLRLRNPYAKMVLMCLANYVNAEAESYVGIPQISEDLELSTTTVRNRLAFLEEIGAISRRPQWINERGVRASEGPGRRTTDMIRLHIYEDDEAVMAACAPDDEEFVSREVNPSRDEGLNSVGGGVRTPLALCQPSSCAKGLISELEPELEDSPVVPSGDESDRAQALEEGEPEHFAPAWEAWPGHQAMRRDLALHEFGKLVPEEQKLCRAAVPLYLAMRKQIGRTTVPDFHRWIRTRGFAEFPTATLAAPAAKSATSDYDGNGIEARALRALYRFVRVPLWEHAGRVVYPLPVTAQVLAFAELPSEREWHWIEDKQQLAAWATFLSTHVHRGRPDLTQTRADGRKGYFAPWPWPPRKDGSISPIGESVGEQGA